MYLQVCRQLGLVPVSYYLRHIDDEQLVLRHHSIDAAAAQAIAAPLAVCIDRLVTSPPPPPPRDSRRGIAFGRVGLFVRMMMVKRLRDYMTLPAAGDIPQRLSRLEKI